ncbi:MAG: glycerol kinase [Omnitrophica WOR_2 bacterium RIFCSPLOWO2_02_FULL_50_19]|nr:MAG: glycerol kinase [Candidatus Uhrbacteria bacterium RIFCSPLOWO2_12_FULL_47_9]OGX32543.1 MAG: glycerol kinase [Omnitrophica WOR_2 bacterium RIFCSPLOWO2_02_FULL_50_19]
MQYILSIDQGTTGSRAYIFDKPGRIVSSAYKEFRQIYPREGWVEHDPDEIWRSVEFVVKQALSRKNIKPSDIAAIGITNQRETTILWDKKTGKPVHNAIVWQCRRTAAMCDKLKKDGYSEIFRKKTGLVIDAYFSATKIKWLLGDAPLGDTLRRRAERDEICFGTVDTWLIWKLTGGRVHATDYTNASRTMIFNIKEKKWDDQLLRILKIPKAILPEVKPSSSIFGRTASNVCGLVPGIPITGVAGDQQAALFGQGCFTAGEMKNTYGTGCFLLLNTGKKFTLSKKGLLTTLACDTRGAPCYAQEGAVFITGAAVQWLRDELKIIKTAAETEKWAKRAKDTGGVYFVPAFVGLGAPYWDSRARGTLTGITRGTGRPHIIRATLEAIAYQVKDIVDIMEEETGNRLKSLRVDGGACRNDLLMQFQADMLGVKIVRPSITETTAKGAAMLAGLAVGFWKSPAELRKTLAAERTFSPRMKNKTRDALYAGWLAAVKKARSA